MQNSEVQYIFILRWQEVLIKFTRVNGPPLPFTPGPEVLSDPLKKEVKVPRRYVPDLGVQDAQVYGT